MQRRGWLSEAKTHANWPRCGGVSDYERLMRLEAMNARKKEGASQQQIDRLPIVSVRYARGHSCLLAVKQSKRLIGIVYLLGQ